MFKKVKVYFIKSSTELSIFVSVSDNSDFYYYVSRMGGERVVLLKTWHAKKEPGTIWDGRMLMLWISWFHNTLSIHFFLSCCVSSRVGVGKG